MLLVCTPVLAARRDFFARLPDMTAAIHSDSVTPMYSSHSLLPVLCRVDIRLDGMMPMQVVT